MNKQAANYTLGQVFLRRLGGSAITLLVIAFLTIFGLIMAERGREGLPAQPLNAAGEALVGTVKHIFAHPPTYIWNHQEIPALQLVWETFSRSAGLLLVSLALATLLGIPLGVAMASRRGLGRSFMVILSTLGVSTPSFFLAMLLWVVNIALFRQLELKPLPPTGFGWDAHLIMPALVLAMRPLAQIAQVTYVSLTEALSQDYIRVAQSKGLSWQMARNRHALRASLLPIFTTVGASLRFSLSTLPVVEFFFLWPGVGLTLIEAIQAGMTPLVTDLILSLGLLFLLVNMFVEFFYPILDPRLRSSGAAPGQELEERISWRQRWADFLTALRDLLQRLSEGWKSASRQKLHPLPAGLPLPSATMEDPLEGRRNGLRWAILRVVGNPALILGTLLAAGLLGLVFFGENLTPASPYEIHGVMMVDGKIGAPPYPPSAVFPWGSDHIGRDIQALVFAGAKNTLSLAFFGMIARVLLGTFLGLLAGWWRNSWFDRMVTGAVGVWAAFPLTLFAMLVIQALGIQQGTWVFVVAICIVGWGEVAQVVRGQVISLRPQPYIEAAHVVGANTGRILFRHILPQLLSPLLVISVLEMGGVLMLLAELGFLNIFLGGGFRVVIGEGAGMTMLVASFSDVPEWGALLSNIRNWWRSYPWMAWYPGVAFFLAIVTFNLWGEGLRRFLETSRLNIVRLFNRYLVMGAAAAGVVLVLMLRSTSPLGVYRETAMQFDPWNAMVHLGVLSSPELQGRETGMPGAEAAAKYIAEQMEAIGLLPGGSNGSYFQVQPAPRFHLNQLPRLQLLDDSGNPVYSFIYRKDYVEWTEYASTRGQAEGKVVGLITGPHPGTSEADIYGLGKKALYDKVILIREEDFHRISIGMASAVLVISEDPLDMQQRYLYSPVLFDPSPPPVMRISRDTADMLLATCGSSLAELEGKAANLKMGEAFLTEPGIQVLVEVLPETSIEENYYNVIGYIPGTGAAVQAPGGVNLDHYVIMVSAYYDGLGVAPDGTLYSGANDNASGVAAMLEMARVLKETPYQPKRTVVFVAWAGGERREGLSLINIMGAKVGFSGLAVDAVIELSGVGSGTGEGIALGEGSSYRLVQLFDRAASRLGVETTTRGRDPHYGHSTRTGFGGRKTLTAYLSWDGSDYLAHTPQDTLEQIDPEKLAKVGRTTLLTLLMLSREVTGW
jgi:ABC-type dipeptide/oligopeptide/nickel transport system permease component